MSDFNCPHCDHPHNDMEGMDDESLEEIECEECGKSFEVQASTHVTYFVTCVDGECIFTESALTAGLMICSVCGDSEIKETQLP